MAFEGLKNLRDLLGVTAAFARLDAAMVHEIEDLSKRVYALEEHEKMDRATTKDLMLRVGKAELAARHNAASNV